ncbi:MAG: rhomboid family intramembrane serine protease, partial [Planctomycetales bacterium]|nr:rhomboid family intramembrane serine protease [Planctomycetales bacterium]
KAKQVTMRRVWTQPLSRRAPLVFALIGLSVFASLATDFGAAQADAFYNALMFCDIRTYLVDHDGLHQIKQGQLWRLVTPIFLHGSIPHLLFNCLCLYSLAPQIEMRRGTVFLGVLTLGLAVVSNLAQFILGGSPFFLGISGVVYGYFGYIWISTKLNPRNGYLVGESTVFMMLFVLVLGFAGLLNSFTGQGGVANWCHAGGLVAGIAAAFVQPRRG